jgi:hypothetical protein
VTGRLVINDTGITVTNKAVLQYGVMSGAVGAATCTPVLDKLVIITRADLPCLGNNLTPVAISVPIMNVYANRPVATLTEAPLQVIEVIVDNVNVK